MKQTFSAAPKAFGVDAPTRQRAKHVNAVFISLSESCSKYHFGGRSLVSKTWRRNHRSLVDPYAKPKERKVGARRPKISHLPGEIDKRTRRQRETEKQAVAAERRAIKKSARQHLKKQLIEESGEDAD